MNDAAGLGQETGVAPPGAMASSAATGQPAPQEPAAVGDALREAISLVSTATKAGITVRLLGGMAVYVLKLAAAGFALAVFETAIAKMRVFRYSYFLGAALMLGLLATLLLFVTQAT